MHPHAIAADGTSCLYMQDTWLVTETGGEPLSPQNAAALTQMMVSVVEGGTGADYCAVDAGDTRSSCETVFP